MDASAARSSDIATSPQNIYAILDQLTAVAEDRIRDGKRAKSLLGSLVRAVRAARQHAATLPVAAVVKRLCYFANARDTALRSASIRIVRYCLHDAAAAAMVCQERITLSLLRSLEREPRYLWERVQALKTVRTLMTLAPDRVPMLLLRSLVSIAAAGPGEASAGSGTANGAAAAVDPRRGGAAAQAGGATGIGGGGAGGAGGGGGGGRRGDRDRDRVDKAGGRYDAGDDTAAAVPAQAVPAGPGGGGAMTSAAPVASGSTPGSASSDNLRRVALDTLRSACLSPVLLPRIAACDGVSVLVDALLECATSPTDAHLVMPLLLTLLRLMATPASRTHVPPSLLINALASVFTSHVGEAPPKDTPNGIGGNNNNNNTTNSSNQPPSATPAVRAKWCAARHLFVSMCRTWIGLLIIANETRTVMSILSLLAQNAPAALQLSVLRLVCDLLSVHQGAVLDGLGAAHVRTATKSGAAQDIGSGYGVDEELRQRAGFLQALSLAYAAQTVKDVAESAALHSLHSGDGASGAGSGSVGVTSRTVRASSHSDIEHHAAQGGEGIFTAETLMGHGGSGGGSSAVGIVTTAHARHHSFDGTIAAATAHGGSGSGDGLDDASSAPNAIAQQEDLLLAHALQRLKAPAGFAAPFFLADIQHAAQGDVEEEQRAWFWTRLGDRASAIRPIDRSARATAAAAAAASGSAAAAARVHSALPFAAGLARHAHSSSASDSNAAEHHISSLTMSAYSVLDFYVSHTLHALMQAGLMRALVCAVMSSHPLVSYAASHTLRFVVRLGLRLWPQQPAAALLHLSDMVQLTSVLSSRTALPTPHSSLLPPAGGQGYGGRYDANTATVSLMRMVAAGYRVPSASSSAGAQSASLALTVDHPATATARRHLLTSIQQAMLFQQQQQQQQQQRNDRMATARNAAPALAQQETAADATGSGILATDISHGVAPLEGSVPPQSTRHRSAPSHMSVSEMFPQPLGMSVAATPRIGGRYSSSVSRGGLDSAGSYGGSFATGLHASASEDDFAFPDLLPRDHSGVPASASAAALTAAPPAFRPTSSFGDGGNAAATTIAHHAAEHQHLADDHRMIDSTYPVLSQVADNALQMMTQWQEGDSGGAGGMDGEGRDSWPRLDGDGFIAGPHTRSAMSRSAYAVWLTARSDAELARNRTENLKLNGIVPLDAPVPPMGPARPAEAAAAARWEPVHPFLHTQGLPLASAVRTHPYLPASIGTGVGVRTSAWYDAAAANTASLSAAAVSIGGQIQLPLGGSYASMPATWRIRDQLYTGGESSESDSPSVPLRLLLPPLLPIIGYFNHTQAALGASRVAALLRDIDATLLGAGGASSDSTVEGNLLEALCVAVEAADRNSERSSTSGSATSDNNSSRVLLPSSFTLPVRGMAAACMLLDGLSSPVREAVIHELDPVRKTALVTYYTLAAATAMTIRSGKGDRLYPSAAADGSKEQRNSRKRTRVHRPRSAAAAVPAPPTSSQLPHLSAETDPLFVSFSSDEESLGSESDSDSFSGEETDDTDSEHDAVELAEQAPRHAAQGADDAHPVDWDSEAARGSANREVEDSNTLGILQTPTESDKAAARNRHRERMTAAAAAAGRPSATGASTAASADATDTVAHHDDDIADWSRRRGHDKRDQRLKEKEREKEREREKAKAHDRELDQKAAAAAATSPAADKAATPTHITPRPPLIRTPSQWKLRDTLPSASSEAQSSTSSAISAASDAESGAAASGTEQLTESSTVQTFVVTTTKTSAPSSPHVTASNSRGASAPTSPLRSPRKSSPAAPEGGIQELMLGEQEVADKQVDDAIAATASDEDGGAVPMILEAVSATPAEAEAATIADTSRSPTPLEAVQQTDGSDIAALSTVPPSAEALSPVTTAAVGDRTVDEAAAAAEADPLRSMVVVKPTGALGARLRNFLSAAAHSSQPPTGGQAGAGGSNKPAPRRLPSQGQLLSSNNNSSAGNNNGPAKRLLPSKSAADVLRSRTSRVAEEDASSATTGGASNGVKSAKHSPADKPQEEALDTADGAQLPMDAHAEFARSLEQPVATNTEPTVEPAAAAEGDSVVTAAPTARRRSSVDTLAAAIGSALASPVVKAGRKLSDLIGGHINDGTATPPLRKRNSADGNITQVEDVVLASTVAAEAEHSGASSKSQSTHPSGGSTPRRRSDADTAPQTAAPAQASTRGSVTEGSRKGSSNSTASGGSTSSTKSQVLSGDDAPTEEEAQHTGIEEQSRASDAGPATAAATTAASSGLSGALSGLAAGIKGIGLSFTPRRLSRASSTSIAPADLTGGPASGAETGAQSRSGSMSSVLDAVANEKDKDRDNKRSSLALASVPGTQSVLPPVAPSRGNRGRFGSVTSAAASGAPNAPSTPQQPRMQELQRGDGLAGEPSTSAQARNSIGLELGGGPLSDSGPSGGTAGGSGTSSVAASDPRASMSASGVSSRKDTMTDTPHVDGQLSSSVGEEQSFGRSGAGAGAEEGGTSGGAQGAGRHKDSGASIASSPPPSTPAPTRRASAGFFGTPTTAATSARKAKGRSFSFISSSAKALSRVMPDMTPSPAATGLIVEPGGDDAVDAAGGADEGPAFEPVPVRDPREAAEAEREAAERKAKKEGRLQQPLGSITWIRDEDEMRDWENVRHTAGGVQGIVAAERRRQQALSVRMRLAILWELVMHTPAVLPAFVSPAGELVVPPSVLPLLQCLAAGAVTMPLNPLPHRLSLLMDAKSASRAEQRPHARPFLSEWLRNTIGRQAFGSRGAAGGAGSKAREGVSSVASLAGLTGAIGGGIGGSTAGGTSAGGISIPGLVSAAMSAVRVSKVLAAKDWRTWDWSAVALLLDHYLTNPTVFAEVAAKSQFLQRLGDFFGRLSADSLCAIPWTPAALRFIRTARQWLLLCLHHPVGRDLLRHRDRPTGKSSASANITGSGADNTSHAAAGAGFAAELTLALWAALSNSIQRLLRNNSAGAIATPAAASTRGLSASAVRMFSTAASRARTAMSSSGDRLGGATRDGTDSLAAAAISEWLGATTPGDVHAALFEPATLHATLARELLSLFLMLGGSPEGRELLCSIRLTQLRLVPDAPTPQTVLELLQQVSSSTPVNYDALRSQVADDVLLSLVHLGDGRYPHRLPLARLLLVSADYTTDGPHRFLLRTWITKASDAAPPVEDGVEGFYSSRELSVYAISLLRAVLRAGAPGFADWGIALLVQLLRSPHSASAEEALSILTEAAMRSRVYRLSILARRPPLRRFPFRLHAGLATALLLEPAGFVLLQKQGLLDQIMEHWLSVEHVRWCMGIDGAVTNALTLSQGGTLLDGVFSLTGPAGGTVATTASGMGGAGTGNVVLAGGSAQPRLVLSPVSKQRARLDRAATLLLPRLSSFAVAAPSEVATISTIMASELQGGNHPVLTSLLPPADAQQAQQQLQSEGAGMMSASADTPTAATAANTNMDDVSADASMLAATPVVSVGAHGGAAAAQLRRGRPAPTVSAAWRLWQLHRQQQAAAATAAPAAHSLGARKRSFTEGGSAERSSSTGRAGQLRSTGSFFKHPGGEAHSASSSSLLKSVLKHNLAESVRAASAANAAAPAPAAASAFSAQAGRVHPGPQHKLHVAVPLPTVDGRGPSDDANAALLRSITGVDSRESPVSASATETPAASSAAVQRATTGAGRAPHVPQPWPIPLLLPTTRVVDADEETLEADAAWCTQLDKLLRLPWRIETWVEWMETPDSDGAHHDAEAAASTAHGHHDGAGSDSDVENEAAQQRRRGSRGHQPPTTPSALRAAAAPFPHTFTPGTALHLGGTSLPDAEHTAATEPAEPLPAQRQRQQLVLDTFVDLTPLRPELRGDGLSGLDADDSFPATSGSSLATTAGGGTNPRVPIPCDLFITGTVMPVEAEDEAEDQQAEDADGSHIKHHTRSKQHTGFILPTSPGAGAVIHATLFCGAHAVSPLGDIPFSAFPTATGASAAAGGTASVGGAGGTGAAASERVGRRSSSITADLSSVAYDCVDEVLSSLLRIGQENVGIGGAAAGKRGQPPAGEGRSRSATRTTSRSRGGRAATGDDGGSEGEDDGDEGDRNRSRSRSQRSRSRTASMSAGAFRSSATKDDHDNLDDANARLRRRNAAAVATLAVPSPRQAATEWVVDAGLADVDTSVRAEMKPETHAAAVAATMTPSSGIVGTTRLPDAVSGGPDAAVQRLPISPAVTWPTTQASAMLRTVAEQAATWEACSVAAVLPEQASAGVGRNRGSLSSNSLAGAQSDDEEDHQHNHSRQQQQRQARSQPVVTTATTSHIVYRCPPGSHARFKLRVTVTATTTTTTSTSASTAGKTGTTRTAERKSSSATVTSVQVELLAVEFGAVLLPKLAALMPARMHLYRALSCHAPGLAHLRESGHLQALLSAAFSWPLSDHDRTHAEHIVPGLQRRAALWALAHVASTEGGYGLLTSVCPAFPLAMDATARGLRLLQPLAASMAQLPLTVTPPLLHAVPETVDDVSVRITALQCLALLARHGTGTAVLTTLGWSCGAANTTGALVFPLPQVSVTAYTLLPGPLEESGSVSSGGAALVTSPPYGKHVGLPGTPLAGPSEGSGTPGPSAAANAHASAAVASASGVDDMSDPLAFLGVHEHAPPITAELKGILTKLADLGSRVSQREARNFLLRAKADRPELFASPALCFHAYGLLSRYNLTLPVRRFIHNLLDRVSFSDKAWHWE